MTLRDTVLILLLILAAPAFAQSPGPGGLGPAPAPPGVPGINQLTGDCTAGPGQGSQAITCTQIGGKAVTLGGALTTSGAYDLTTTLSNTTAITLPTTGTLATLTGAESLTGKVQLGITAPTVNTTPLTISGYSLTGAAASPMVSLAGTWNTTGMPTAIDLNVTDTASNAASLLLDLRVGGVSQASISKNGQLNTNRIFTGGVGVGTGIFNNNIVMADLGSIHWTGSSSYSAADLALRRDGAGILAQRNGTNAQIDRIYKTWTSASVGAWAEIDAGVAAADTLTIGSRSNGGAAGMTKLDVLVDGTSALDYGKTTAGTWSAYNGSAYLPLKGKLTTDTNYTAGDPTTTGYLLIYDATGTAYRVPALLN